MALIDNCEIYYSFDDDDLTGSNPDDLTGNNDGVRNGATTGGSGIIGQSFSFDGVNDTVVSSSNVGITGGGNKSISFWIKTTSAIEQNAGLVGWGTFSSGKEFRILQTVAGSHGWFLWGYFSDCFSANSTYIINDGVWHHIVATLTSSGTVMKIYWDGILAETCTVDVLNTGNSVLGIGYEPSFGDYTLAEIDEVGIWSKALSDGGVSDEETAGGEIAELYNSGVGLQYPFISSSTVKALVVAGGGAGGGENVGNAGGGGAGGLLYDTSLQVLEQGYTITVGSGGSYADNTAGGDGGDSTFSSITSTGGGGGGCYNIADGRDGGSGGGQAQKAGAFINFGLGIAGQGFDGGDDPTGISGGGGGGSSEVGEDTNGASDYEGGDGGAGTSNSISGSAVDYAGGGGGATHNSLGSGVALGGLGGGGDGQFGATLGEAGATNTGSGGGGGGEGTNGGVGGTGIVIMSYATDGSDGVSTSSTGGTITTSGGQTIHTFTSNGTFTVVYSGAGWSGKIFGISSPSKVDTVIFANISKINTV